MKTKTILLSVFIFLHKPLISQEIDNFLGVYTIQQICSSTIFGIVDTLVYEIDIVESSKDTCDIEYYIFEHFQDTIRANVLNDNEFQIPVQWFRYPPTGDISRSISGEGSVYNDSIFINYYIGGPTGGYDCKCKGRDKDATGLNEGMSVVTDLLIYPNPLSDELIILGETNQIIRYKIFNLNGKLISHGECCELNSISISSLPAGLYFLSLRNRNGQISTTRFQKL